MRLLLDNNILVSSLLSPHGPPGQLAEAWREGRFELLTAEDQLQRLEDVLARPKIRQIVTQELTAQLLADLRTAAVVIEPRRDVTLSTDPEDNLILGIAVAGQADLVVSGDKRHLLPLQHVEQIPIVTAVVALQLLAARPTPPNPPQKPG